MSEAAMILDPKTGARVPLDPIRHAARPALHDWEIARDADGKAHAVGAVSATVDAAGSIVKRTAIKKACTPDAYTVRWLRIELDGVKVYFDGAGHLVVTKADLWP